MENLNKYNICSETIMDTTDRKIKFDENNISDHAINFHKNVKPKWVELQKDRHGLEKIINKIKTDGKKRDFSIPNRSATFNSN